MFKQYKNSDYDIYDDGRCYSHKTNKFLTPKMSVKYPTYNLTIDGKKKNMMIHRMVAETFLVKVDGKNIVNHIDGDTHNFHVSNLKWCDYKENSQHAIDTGLRKNGDQTIVKYTSNLPNEKWAPAKDFPNYVVSSHGRIMNIKTKRLLKQYLNRNGYYEVNLWKNNKGTTTQVHKIIYCSFNVDDNLEGFVINHIDGNKTNNNISNLEKVTHSENNYHATYTIKTNKSAKPIYQLDKEDNIIGEFPSIAEAQRQLHISNISRAIKTNTVAGGFYWMFKKTNN